MANWSNPTLTSTYTNFLAELKARDDDLAKQFDGQTVSNLVDGSIRWNSSINRWQKWNATSSSWGELATTYALTGLSTTGNASIGGTLTVTGATTLASATATTPATADNSTALATTAWVRNQAYATLASPALTGTPTAPTAAVGTNTTQLATTAYVNAEIANDAPTKTGGGASGTWAINISGSSASCTGNASTASSSPLLSALANYVWSASSLPTAFSQGIQASFVSSSQGFQNFGSVVTVNTYSGGGGALQLYVPYSPSNGGTGLQVRFGNYDVSSGNSWTSWKTLLASDNYTSYAPSLTGSGASGTWGINITGSAGTVSDGAITPAKLAASVQEDLLPPGAVSFFARNTAPTGWLKANGAAVSRSVYADLFAAIGTTFGAGNGSTTFNLPDLRGEFPRCWDDGRGVDSGRAFGSFQDQEFAAHNHGVTDPGHQHQVHQKHAASVPAGGTGILSDGNGGAYFGIPLSGVSATGISIQNSGGAETRPRNVALLACIKF